MVTKMVATWRVGLERFMYSVQRNISSLLVREQDSHNFDHYFDLCVDDIYFYSISSMSTPDLRPIQFLLSLWATIK